MQVKGRWFIYLLMGILCANGATAQIVVKGTVYDGSMLNGLGEVDVHSGSGATAATDTLGRYHIKVPETDSIFFEYLGKRTAWFPVKLMANPDDFEISMYGIASVNLTPVTVTANSYHLDSLQNREEYKELFDYGDPGMIDGGKMHGRQFGVGLDFDMLLTGRAIEKSRMSTQRYLIEDEKQRYIDHRFNKALVGRLTGLTHPALDSFMKMYRPSYDQLKTYANEIEYYQYIQEAGKSFKEYWPEIVAAHDHHVADSAYKGRDDDNEPVGRQSQE